MAFKSGLASQFGFAAESTYGTQVTVDHFVEHNKADFSLDQTWAINQGLRAGGQFPRSVRAVRTTRTAGGTLEFDVPTNKIGILVRHMIGSAIATPTLISGSAYKQVHQSGNADGLSLTTQIGRPQSSDGTVKPFTYTGSKIVGWELSCEQGGLLKASLEFDCRDELTLATSPASNALAAASYTAAAELFPMHQASIKAGGTASTASSEVSIAGGTSIASLIKSFTIKGTRPSATERFGTSQTKSEPVHNGWTEVTATFDAEFGAQADLYDVFRAGTVTPIEITFTGSTITGGNNTFSIIMAAGIYQSVKAEDNEADLVGAPAEIRAFDDGTNNPFQIKLISTDTTL